MRSLILFTVLVVIISISAEPLRYRAELKVKELEKQQDENPHGNHDCENIEVTTTNNGKKTQNNTNEKQVSGTLETEEPRSKEEPTTTTEQSSPLPKEPPYVPSGWRPAGKLLVLPAGVLYVAAQPLPVTTEVAEPTTESVTGEINVIGLAATEEAVTDSTTTESATTEPTTVEDDSTDETTTVAGEKLGHIKVETISEPDAESVEVETTEPSKEAVPEVPQHEQPPSPQAVNTFFVQLSDGSFQRVVFLNAQAPFPNAPVTAAYTAQPFLQSQQLVVNPFSSFGTPKLVTYTSQYQSSW